MIDTDAVSSVLREDSIRPGSEEILVSRLHGSDQATDITMPTNCGGLGRRHRFSTDQGPGWPRNPLPLEPAKAHLGPTVGGEEIEAEVFQNAACNWRCWYCFVPFNLLRADAQRSEWISAVELVDRYLALENRPPVLDLSGGQPDLVPEWSVWTLRALKDRGADQSTFLWSDDNLSNDYLFRYLTPADITLLAESPGYGRVGCLKGFDPASFTFNTGAEEDLFERQLELVNRLAPIFPRLNLYITLTAASVPRNPRATIAQLFERLDRIDPNLISRTVPLRVFEFSPTTPRMREAQREALVVQSTMVGIWQELLAERTPKTPA